MQVDVAFDRWHRQSLHFVTADPPATVIAWYHAHLEPPAWRLPFPAEDDVMIITNQQGCPVYSLEITATATAKHQTQVKLDLSPELCVDR